MTTGQIEYKQQTPAEKFLKSERTLYIGGETLKPKPEDVKYLPDGAWLRVYWLASSNKIIAAEPLTEDEISRLPGG